MNENIRTDLAVELNEEVSKQSGKLNGIIVNEYKDSDTDISVSEIKITNKNGEKALGKPQGTYITIEAQGISNNSDIYKIKVSEILSSYINKLLEENINLKADSKNKKLLVVGLGNRCITSDSLGPLVADGLDINYDMESASCNIELCAIVPGVMADTGLETADIVRGIAKQIKPAAVIVIDALAARNINRLNTTIQLSDKGINPGSGVGNHRVGINKENIGVPVLAIGVPTVIDATTIVSDLVSPLMVEFTLKDREEFFAKIYKEGISDMYVTPKAIDADVKNISCIISHAINSIA